MRCSRWFLVGAAALLAALGLSISGCNAKPWQSNWLSPAATVQSNPDWWKLPAYRLDKLNGTVAIVNDSSAVYLRFFSRDHRLARRLEMAGLTVWFANPHGKKAERVGIHYPMGMRSRQGSFRPDHFLPDANLSPEAMNDMIDRRNDEFEILRGDSTLSGAKPWSEAAQFGIDPVISLGAETAFEYTLRINFGDLARWIKPGSSVLMTMDSPALDRSSFGSGRGGEQERGERPESGMGRGGGFGGRGGGWRGRGEGHSDSTRTLGHESEGIPPTSPIKISVTVQLAANSSSGKGDSTAK